jgi:hypothetical protein
MAAMLLADVVPAAIGARRARQGRRWATLLEPFHMVSGTFAQ